MAFDPARLDRAYDWLRKPLNSAGGSHIVRHENGHSDDASKSGCYFQQYIEGSACSAVYIAARGQAVLLGVTRQLIGQKWAGADGFQYCGSVGPLNLSAQAESDWMRLGSLLSGEFGLVGLFGVDAITNARGVWPVEINPRYTASVEILERAFGICTLDWHIAACESGELAPRPAALGRLKCGKAIVFAERSFLVPSIWEPLVEPAAPNAWPAWADMPRAGSTIETGWPILTALAAGADEHEVLERLKRSAAAILAAHRI